MSKIAAGVVVLVVVGAAVGVSAQTPTRTATPAVFKFVLPNAVTNPPNQSWANQLVSQLMNYRFCDPKFGCENQSGGGGGGGDTATPADTPTRTQTFTPTAIFTSSPTFTQTHTFTSVPTWTNTATFTQTHTFTPIPTWTNTATFTETHTVTPIPTWTSTATFTNTPSFTATFTFTRTPTFTPTSTPVNSSTPTVTPTELSIFKIIDTSSGTDPVADNPGDTLIMSATSPMVFTGDSTLDKVTGSWDFSVANTWTGQQTFDANAKWNDNDTAIFGTGDDALISYDGTDLIVNADSVGTGITRFSTMLELMNGGGTFTTTPADMALIYVSDAFTIDAASQAFAFVKLSSTITWEQNGSVFGSMSLFLTNAVNKNPSGENRTFGWIRTFYDGQQMQADTTTSNNVFQYDSFNSTPTFNRINSGVLTVDTFNNVNLGGAVSAGDTVTSRVAINIADMTGAGTLSANQGIEIAALAKGAVNIGIRNASTEIDTPPAVQSITAVGQAITVASKYKIVSSNAAYVLTAAPTIATGFDGQIVFITNVGANNITVQDQGTLANSNLRLITTTVVIGPRDTLALHYDATVGDWIEDYLSNVI